MRIFRSLPLAAALAISSACPLFAQVSDITQPGDPIIPSSANSPGSEAVANAIDNQPTKYLNFDSGRNGFLPSGFVVSPSVGITHVTGVSMQSANDAPERDPKTITLEGSNDATVSGFNSGTWTLITTISNIPPYSARFQTKTFSFNNPRPYRHYRWIVTETQTTPNGCCMQIAEVELLGTTLPSDVTQPGDTIFASSANSPGSEAVANVIDNQPTKYLNFDSGRNGFLPSGFAVSPSIGRTLVNAISMQSANDAPERDPKTVTLEGSNDPTLTGYNTGTWELITTINNIPAYSARFQTQTFFFDNPKPYRHYRWVVSETQTTPNGCCMQIAEVELLGSSAPRDVTQPGDPIIPSSANSPGSEAVANAIDDQPTKYLNFDSGRNGFLPSGFVVSPRIGRTTLVGLTMQSANDAPERDPKVVTLEGSNDDTITGFNSGNWTLITTISGIPPYTARFQTKEFFFSNTVSYKHYRWIVTETQTTPNGCCMQIAEVEFLAVPQAGNTNVIDTLIRRQPKDTPVLLGSQATFRVLLTGPWNVQWYKNGAPIPGATAATYTTPAATQGDDGSRFKAVVSSPQGTQVSDEVMLSIFTPSTTESIGLSWRGGGANGAPTDLLPADTTGFHQQAYWNNLSGGSSTLANPTNSFNQPHSSITVQWATSGEWGVGTGNNDPTERLFNGLATSSGTTAATAQTVTLSGIPAGSHSLLLYTVQVPLEFFNMNFSVVTFNADGTEKAVQQRFIRPQNADEYNPAPGFLLVTADTAASRSVGNMMRFDNLQTDNGSVQVRFYSPGRAQPPGAEPIRGPGLNALQLLVNPPAVLPPPQITHQPVSANGILGGQVTLLVEATGPSLTYQWSKNGQPIAGATTPEFTLSGLTTNDAGNYTVAVTNPTGRLRSRTAVVGVLSSGQLTAGAITYFKLDEGSGFIASNSVAGGAPGDVRAFFDDWAPGQIGNSLVFADGQTHLFVTNYPKVSKAITVAGWVQSSSSSWGPLINNWVNGRAIGAGGQFFVDVVTATDPTSGTEFSTLRGQIEVGPNQIQASGVIDASLNVWHHFAMSANGVTLSIYWDGQLISTVDYLGNINATAFPWLVMGARYTVVPEDPNPVLEPGQLVFLGLMDDIAMWNRSLSDVELFGIYSGGLSGKDISQVPPVLNINRSPVGADDTATTPQATAVSVNVLANDTDPDNDTLIVTSVTAPTNGTATVNAGGLSVTYTPNAGFLGADSFTYRIGDGHGGIGSGVVRVTVTDNVPPQVHCPGDITADATAAGNAVVNYIASASDAGGLQSFACVPSSGSTFPLGDTTVVCTARDIAGNTASCSFKVTVRIPNLPPIADASATATNVISANGSNAVVHLDGTRSSDPDGDVLTYSWLADGSPVPIASGAVATAVLEVGTHQVVLVVDDGIVVDSDTVEVHVITAAEAVEDLILKVNEAEMDRKTKRPFIASLKAATASFDRGSDQSGLNQLAAFQNKVRAQIARNDPALAEELIAAAQAIIDALQAP